MLFYVLFVCKCVLSPGGYPIAGNYIIYHICVFRLLFVLFSCYLCYSMYCLCVNVYFHRVATQLQLNISYHIIYHIISYHIISYHICVVRLLLFVLFSCYLCCSMYCLCVNVYFHRMTTQLQLINISYLQTTNLSLCINSISCLRSGLFRRRYFLHE